MFAQSGSSISTPFLVVVVFCLTVLFVSFGLFAARNPTAIVTLLSEMTPVSLTSVARLPHPGKYTLARRKFGGGLVKGFHGVGCVDHKSQSAEKIN